ncbi:MAG: tetratricopeptide repeat protein [Deltaproteobacteria bacterium]|nr:tetratricopeptide repeat protein [Deltaproteobacteria bacterium]
MDLVISNSKALKKFEWIMLVFLLAFPRPADAGPCKGPIRTALMISGVEDQPEIGWAVTLVTWQDLLSMVPGVLPISLYDTEQALFQCEAEEIVGYPRVPADRAEADVVVSGKVSKTLEPKGFMLEITAEPTGRRACNYRFGKTLFAKDPVSVGHELSGEIQSKLLGKTGGKQAKVLSIDAVMSAAKGLEMLFRRSCRLKGCPNDPAGGVRLLETAIGLDPGLVSVRILLAEVYLHSRKPAKAAAVIEPAMNRNYLAALLFGRAMESGGLSDKAYKAYSTARRSCPRCCGPLTALAGMSASKGETRHAMELYDKAISFDPGCSKALFSKALLLHRKGRNLAKVAGLYEEAARLSPANPDIFYYLGLARAALGEMDQAISAFRKALEAGPEFPDAWRNLGVALLKTGKRKEALEAFKKCLKYAPKEAPYRSLVEKQITELK